MAVEGNKDIIERRAVVAKGAPPVTAAPLCTPRAPSSRRVRRLLRGAMVSARGLRHTGRPGGQAGLRGGREGTSPPRTHFLEFRIPMAVYHSLVFAVHWGLAR